MSFLDDAIAANHRYAAELDDALRRMPPFCKAAVLVCMDTRIDPMKILGMQEGDANVIRNAGGRTTDDAIRSLVISNQLLGSGEFLVIHHTECGLHSLDADQVRSRLLSEQGIDCSDLDFLPFTDLDQSVIDDVESIANSRYVPAGVPITGLVYDVQAGVLRQVAHTTSRGRGR